MPTAVRYLLIVVILAAIAAAALYFASPRSAKLPQITAPESGQTPEGKVLIVEMSAEGFSPTDLIIPQGSVVRFVNVDSEDHWPASGEHPTHQICRGFDALGPVPPGGKYEHVFNYRPIFGDTTFCPMHDHLNPELTGTIAVIQEENQP